MSPCLLPISRSRHRLLHCFLNPNPLRLLFSKPTSSSPPSPPIQTQNQSQQQQQQPEAEQTEQKQGEDDLPSLLCHLVLTHPSDDPRALSQTLALHFPGGGDPQLLLPAHFVDRALKLLWNDGPRALLFFRSLLLLPSFRPAASSFDHAADLAARLRDDSSLRQFLSLRRRLRIPPSHRTFAILFERLVAAGRPDRAVRAFLSMHRDGGPRQDLASFNTLLDVLCKSQRVEKASSLLRALRGRFPPDAVTYNIIADGWCRLQRTSKAMDVLREMVEAGVDPTKNTYNILLKGFFRAGQVTDAMRFFKQMKKRGRSHNPRECLPDVVSYTTVVHGLGLVGQLEKARQVFDEMIDQGCLPSVATYNALIQVICKKGRVADAIVVFEEMLKKGYTPNSITYNLVIRGLCHAGEMDRAMDFHRRMKLDECEPTVQTYNVLIKHWFEQGEIEKGMELFENMKIQGGSLPNLDTYNVIISAMFVRKRPEDMLVAGRMAMEMVERGHFPRRLIFNRILNGLLLTGNQSFVKDLLRLQESHKRLHKIRL